MRLRHRDYQKTASARWGWLLEPIEEFNGQYIRELGIDAMAYRR